MKHLKYILIIAIFAGVYSCELPDNIDPKSPTIVPAATVFGNGLVNMVDQVNTINQNWNISRLLAQYAAQTTYYDEGRYNWLDRNIPDSYWGNFYRDALMDLDEARKLTEVAGGLSDGERANRLAMIEVCQCYIYQVLVDAFGDIPYSGGAASFANEALMGVENPSPAYDDGEAIYSDLLARLTAASSTLNANTGGFGGSDYLFNGDDEGWRKFANSLRLRIAMRLSDVNPTLSVSAANAAITQVCLQKVKVQL
jgi:hypothetical protein